VPILVASLLISLIQFEALAEEKLSYAPKLGARLSTGLLQNQGTIRGDTPTVGGLNLSYFHFPTRQWGIGAGYRAEFDYVKKSLPFSGLVLATRWYFYGAGTRVDSVNEGLRSETLDDYGFYVGPQVGLSNYYFGLNPADKNKTDVLEGSFLGAELTGGMDFRLNRKFELNAEGVVGIFSFARSDDRFRIRVFLFNFGISYLW